MSILQPFASLKHLDLNRYPMCSASLVEKPGMILRSVSPVIIDTRGVFPFLLFRLSHQQSGLVVFCVRGSASYPSDRAIERLYRTILSARFHVDVEGGGSISFANNCVQIFGASEAFGRSDHHLVGKLIKFCFPGMKIQYEPAPQAKKTQVAGLANSGLMKKGEQQQQQQQQQKVPRTSSASLRLAR